MVSGLFLFSIYLACLVPASLSACDQGWFGSSCQFKCRCAKGCDVTGLCVNATACSLGWFGPLCQYQDLANVGATVTPNTTRATDGNDTSCSSLQNLTISWPTAYLINWVQLIIPNASIATLPVMTFRVNQATSSTTLPCLNNQTKVYNMNTVDVYCNLSSAVQFMTLTFASNTTGLSVCSIYISGGRNVALRAGFAQTNNYTSDSITYYSLRAVDGNTTTDFNQNSCSSTFQGKVYWNLTFSQTVNVNRFILYNRKDFQDKLKGFKLLCLSRNNTTFNYTDNQTTALSVYTITTNSTVAADSVSISVDNNNLTLCEVEIYGDNTCENKKFGTNCSHCRCNDPSEICFPTTGSCLSGCAPGYFGDSCQQVCAAGSYGLQCKQTCGYCADVVCDSEKGVCRNGCVAGYTGLHCNQTCENHFYGSSCTKICSPNCMRSECNATNGFCFDCATGYIGDFCENLCPEFQYGDGCLKNCSENCGENGTCNRISGVCTDGCKPGYRGSDCTLYCEEGLYGTKCSTKCNRNCLDGRCHFVTGRCFGCVPGFEGPQCERAMKPMSDNLGRGFGIGFGVACLILIVLLVVAVVVLVRMGRLDLSTLFHKKSDDVNLDSIHKGY